MKHRRIANQTYLKCPDCGNVQSIYRKLNKQREEGHCKHLWCYRCRAVTKHTEHKREWMFENLRKRGW